jgi:hypothetical protein
MKVNSIYLVYLMFSRLNTTIFSHSFWFGNCKIMMFPFENGFLLKIFIRLVYFNKHFSNVS